ncbi:MAG: 50S ribosomal protein L25 [Acholeplasmataceae bacterium]
MKVNLRTRSLNEVRKERMIPGVMYGKSIESTSIEVDEKAFKEALAEYGKSMTFKVTLDGKKHNVYIKSVQSNILKPQDIIHFELHRIAKDETVSAQIPVVVHGKEILEKSRLYVQLVLQDIHCEYAPGSGIQHFEFDASEMEMDQAVHVKDIEVPKGITIHEDPEHIVFIVKESRETIEEEETETEEAVEGEEVTEETVE